MSDSWQEHEDPEVQHALDQFCDRLCTWERSTGRTSILVLREAGGFQFRADSGKPLDSSSDDITDEQLFEMLRVDASGF